MRKAIHIPITHFASAERRPIKIVHRQAAALKKGPVKLDLLDSGLNYVFVLNRQRQIVFASRNVRDLIRRKRQRLVGRRPGEVLGCVHAGEGKGGCGTSESCPTCGAIQAILSSLAGRTDLREFRLARVIGCQKHVVQFLVITAPLIHQRQAFTLFALTPKLRGRTRQAIQRVLAGQVSI